jgi:hypothetical protein
MNLSRRALLLGVAASALVRDANAAAAFGIFQVSSGSTDIWASQDGRANAPAAGFSIPTLLNQYVPTGPAQRQRYFNGSLDAAAPGRQQPPWMVAGVDYPVGIDRSVYPTNGSLAGPTNSTNFTVGSGVCTLSGPGPDIVGVDFTGFYVSVTGGPRTFRNCYFKQIPNGGPLISATTTMISLTLTMCEIDGNNGAEPNQGAPTQGNVQFDGSGTHTITYCYIHDTAHVGVNPGANGGSVSSAPFVYTLVYRYNFYSNTAAFSAYSGLHNDWFNVGGTSRRISNATAVSAGTGGVVRITVDSTSGGSGSMLVNTGNISADVPDGRYAANIIDSTHYDIQGTTYTGQPFLGPLNSVVILHLTFLTFNVDFNCFYQADLCANGGGFEGIFLSGLALSRGTVTRNTTVAPTPATTYSGSLITSGSSPASGQLQFSPGTIPAWLVPNSQITGGGAGVVAGNTVTTINNGTGVVNFTDAMTVGSGITVGFQRASMIYNIAFDDAQIDMAGGPGALVSTGWAGGNGYFVTDNFSDINGSTSYGNVGVHLFLNYAFSGTIYINGTPTINGSSSVKVTNSINMNTGAGPSFGGSPPVWKM